jgi:Uncharacterized protein conserved in bacteria (DUF2188)
MKKAVRPNAHRKRTSKQSTQLRLPGSEKSRHSIKIEQAPTSDITYEIVQHDGGWAYKVNGVFSEPFQTHAEAFDAAQSAAAEQELPGDAETIEYEDEKGVWHYETVSGRDRPHPVVKDTNPNASAVEREDEDWGR